MSLTTIQKIRAIIQDDLQAASETFTVTGGVSYQLTYFPVVGTSVVCSAGTFTVVEASGTVIFTSAPTGSTITITYSHVNLLDDTIQVFIDLEDAACDGTADIRLAAADCLDSIASSQALILKKIKILDLQTDGPAVADSLRKHAENLRDQVTGALGLEPCFDIIEQVEYEDWAAEHEKLVKDILRSGL